MNNEVCLDDPIENLDRIGDVLSGSWELTQRIFENLSFREVSRLRAVCKTWADVGAKIIEKRRRLHYLTIHPHNIPTTEGKVTIGELSPSGVFEGFFEHIVSKPRYCLSFCNENWIARTDVFQENGSKGNLTLSQYIAGSLPSSCEFGLAYAKGVVGTVEHPYQGHLLESAKNINQDILSYLYGSDKDGKRPSKRRRRSNSLGMLPKENQIENTQDATSSHASSTLAVNQCDQCCTSSSVAVNFPERKSTVGYSIEVEEKWEVSLTGDSDAFSLLLIPHHPGVHFKFFYINEMSYIKNFHQGVRSDKFTISTSEFNQMTSLSDDDQLSALLLFDIGLEEDFVGAFLNTALTRQNHNVAIGGGIVASVSRTGELEPSVESGLGVAVCGPNVIAASLIIPRTVSNPKNLDDYMKQLKSCGLPENQSLAFMFSCCGRGRSWYRRRGSPWFDYNNVETKAFRKAFPTTPIFGFFGGGEIGVNYLPKFSASREDSSSQKKRTKRLFHQFSTVIVLLSFL